MKKYLIVTTISILIIVITLTAAISAFLLDQKKNSYDFKVGDVNVDAVMYFEKDDIITPAQEVVIDPINNITKKGIYNINVVDSESIEFIENVRIGINVYSTVDTYLRIKLIEQMTLTTENYLGVKVEIPIIAEPSEFNYSELDWFYGEDGYYYYKNKVKQQSVDNPTILNMISTYFDDVHYNTRPLGYSLQMGIRVEAVQALDGPTNNWGLETPPWGGQW